MCAEECKDAGGNSRAVLCRTTAPTIRIYDYIGDAGAHNATPGELGWVPLQLTPITQGGARA